MSRVRRTISLPPALDAQLVAEATRRGVSFSALVAQLAEDRPNAVPYAGLVDDDDDLSLRVEEVLSRLAR